MSKPNRTQPSPTSILKPVSRHPTRTRQAPPPYKPEGVPKCLQPKAATQRPSSSTPLAPPASRPQPASKTLQTKPSTTQPPPKPGPGQRPTPPPAYRPQPVPKVLQRKKAAAPQPFQTPVRTPAAPPVYRPQPVPKVLQKKVSGPLPQPPAQVRRQPSAPPVYRPQPAQRNIQPHAHKGAVQLKPQPRGVELKHNPAPRGARHQTSGVVQRAIGFEYELGVWTSRKTSNDQFEHLPKGYVLWREPGFDVTADQQVDGRSDLEIIVKEIDDRPLGSRTRMANVLQSVVTLLNELKKRQGRRFPAQEINPNADASLYLNVPRGSFTGSFQATAGLSLDALYAIRSGQASKAFTQSETKSKLSKDEKEVRQATLETGGGGADPDIWKEVMRSMPGIRMSLGINPTENLDHLAAVISMMVTIPITSRTTSGPYPKSLSGSMLARTDYAAILNLLPRSQQAAIASRPNVWARELTSLIERAVRAITGRQHLSVSQGEAVFQQGSVTDAATPGLSMEEWFKGLAGRRNSPRVDKLTTNNYPSNYSDQEAEDLESLGAFGSKMDPGEYTGVRPGLGLVGPTMMALGASLGNENSVGGGLLATGAVLTGENPVLVKHEEYNRPIFEFRTLGSINPGDLVEAGLGLWDYVDMAHGRSQSYVSLSTGIRLWNLATSFL